MNAQELRAAAYADYIREEVYMKELSAQFKKVKEVFIYPNDFGLNVRTATLLFKSAQFRTMPERNVPDFNHLLTIDQE